MHGKLASLIESIPLIQKLFPFDSMLVLADTEKFIYYSPGTGMDIKLTVGKTLTQGDGIWEVVQSKTPISNIVPKEVWGFSFRNASSPIIDDAGKLIGVIGLASSLATQEKTA